MNTRKIHNSLLTHYLLISLIISGLVFGIFLFFTTKVSWFPLDFYTLIAIVPMSILIVYQCFLIKHTYTSIGSTFRELCPLFQNNYYRTFSQEIKRRLQKSWLFYATIILVIASFIIIELERLHIWRLGGSDEIPNFFYLYEPAKWSLLLDIFNHIVAYVILFMLAIIIWMMIELIIIINKLLEKDTKNRYRLKINVFKVEEKGGLKPLNSFILFTVCNYFIIIAFFVISYVPPNKPVFNVLVTPEIVLLFMMLLIGVILFFTTQKAILYLIDEGVRLELERINQNYQDAYNRVIEICSSKSCDDKSELEKLKVTMDILEKEKTKIKQIKDKKFDIKTMSTFFTSIVPPTFTLIQKMYPSLSENFVSYVSHIINIKIRI